MDAPGAGPPEVWVQTKIPSTTVRTPANWSLSKRRPRKKKLSNMEKGSIDCAITVTTDPGSFLAKRGISVKVTACASPVITKYRFPDPRRAKSQAFCPMEPDAAARQQTPQK
mmetsp:Transcript_96172/g.170722  ORF Transcript_96172/g.170722 Transcript_96172/m.170722 type:complete len:112 (+) Transcript_96172:537-872(+)